MNVIYLCLRALKEIIDDKRPVQAVLNDFNNEYNLSLQDKALLSKTLRGSIRHFFLLSYQAGELFPSFESDDDEIYLLIPCLYQLRYLKKDIAAFQVIDELLKVNDDLLLRLDPNETKEKLTSFSSSKFKLSKEIMQDYYKCLSFMFSTPEWVVKLYAKEYGDDMMLNVLKSKSNHVLNYLRVNTSKVFFDEIAALDTYHPIEEVGGAVTYSGKENVSKSLEYQHGKIFSCDLSWQILIDEFSDVSYKTKCLQIGEINGGLSSGIAVYLKGQEGNLDVSFETEISYRHAKYQYQRLGLDNIKAYMADLDMLRTYLPYSSYDVVFVTPKSSFLGQLSKRPSIALTITSNELKKITKKEMACLEEGAKYLLPSGVLVYACESILKEEGPKIVSSFLKRHKDYVLAKEKTIFPYEYNSYGMYYAILEKEE